MVPVTLTTRAAAVPVTEAAETSEAVKPWQMARDEKRAEQLSRIPAAWRLSEANMPAVASMVDLRPAAATAGILSERELEITGEKYDATSLAAAIARGTYTATETVTAFCKRAAISQQLCRSLTEICFAEAIEKAEKLDAHFQATGKTVGLFHGLAMTFKECFHVEGFDACNGYVARIGVPSTTTTPIIRVAEEAGAVLIAKTNVPQTMLVCECDNNVFGQTRNPVVSHLSCGGSSGGEGSLSAFRGNAFGVGTDVAGSIRVPSAFNGVYGYKPSVGVLPFIGYAASGWTGVNTGIPAVLGPIGRSVRDLALFTDAIRARKPWKFDPAIIPGIMEQPAPTKKPVVGILYESGITPHPPVRRAIREAQAKLEVAGFQTKDFTPVCPDFKEIRDIAAELITLDGLSYQRQQLAKAGEPVVPSVSRFGYWKMERKKHEEIWELNTRKGALQKQMLDAWYALGIDVLIAPATPHAPIPSKYTTSELYTVPWNIVDYPAIIIPFTVVDPALDKRDTDFVPKNQLDAEVAQYFDPELMAGAPVSLQLVGMRLNDRALLSHAETLDKVLNGKS